MDYNQKPQTTAGDFFLQISCVVTLYVSAVSFLAFIFNVIDVMFPDRQAYAYDPYSSALRIAISTLIVAFPLFIYLSRRLRKALVAHPEKKDIWVRKWLTYLTLFVSGVALSIDVVTLVNSFLGGEITSRFILKVLAVLVVVGVIFWYYIADLRGKFFANPNLSKIATWITVIVVALSVIGGFFVIGSPANQRKLRDDNQRVSDLTGLQYQVLNYYQNSGVLPKQLDVLSDAISGYVVPTDPETGMAYVYRVSATSSLTFDLCATFATDATQNKNSYPTSMAYPVDSAFGNVTWQHVVGEQCFTRKIDPLKYPVLRDIKKGALMQ